MNYINKLDEKAEEIYDNYKKIGKYDSLITVNDIKQIKGVLYESIPLADRFIQAIHQTFHDREMITNFLCSKKVQEFINSKDFKHEDLAEFARALVRKNKTLLI